MDKTYKVFTYISIYIKIYENKNIAEYMFFKKFNNIKPINIIIIILAALLILSVAAVLIMPSN